MIGFLLVDKPEGPSSHDVVAAARRALGVKRVGHAGTLDPPASGLLVLGVGAATRLLSWVQRLEKTYQARGVLGVRTSTLDAAGEVVSTSPVEVTEQALREALGRLVGEIDQTPPAVSAVKVGGERAYKKVLRGETVELQARRVLVYEIDLVDFDPPSFGIRVRCSAGTYVRSLVADVGETLGCGAHVVTLRRTAIGHLRVEDAVVPDAIDPEALMPVAAALAHLPRVDLDAETARRARFGQRVEAAGGPSDGEVLVCGPDGPVGVFRAERGILRPVTVLPPD